MSSDPGSIPIGIIAYHATMDLARCLQSIRQHTPQPHRVGVFDNTEVHRNNADLVLAMGADLISHGTNVGCAVSRNRIWRWAQQACPGSPYMVIMDQDVRVQAGWLGDALELMERRPSAGIVCWPCANMGERPVRSDGCISMAASVCNVHRMAAVEKVGGWDETFFMYRFDSLFAQRTNQAGYRTFLVMKHYDPRVRWMDQRGGIIHDHPHQGVQRNPAWQVYRAKSDEYYTALKAREGWVDFDPMSEPPVA